MSVPEAAEKAKKFDIASLDLAQQGEQGAEFELVHPVSGAGLGIYITVLSTESDTFKRLIRERTNKRIRETTLLPSRGPSRNAGKILTVEEQEANTIETLVECTQGWRNMVEDGKDLPFGDAAAQMVYSKYRWIANQVDAAMADLSLFIKS